MYSLHQTAVRSRVYSNEQEDLGLPLLCRLGVGAETLCLPSSYPARLTGHHKVKNASFHYLASVPSQELHAKQPLNHYSVLYKGIPLNSDSDQESKIWTRKAMHFPTRYVHISVEICTLVQVPVEARRGHQIPLKLELPVVCEPPNMGGRELESAQRTGRTKH